MYLIRMSGDAYNGDERAGGAEPSLMTIVRGRKLRLISEDERCSGDRGRWEAVFGRVDSFGAPWWVLWRCESAIVRDFGVLGRIERVFCGGGAGDVGDWAARL